MNTKLYSRMLLGFSLAFLIQCAPGFRPNQSPNTDPSNTGDNNSATHTPSDETAAQHRKALEAIIKNADMTGSVAEGPSASGVVSIDFNRATGSFLLRIPMIVDPVLLSMSFPEYPGMKLYVEYVNDRPFLTLSIPVKYVLRNVTEVVAKLPNGDRVPYFPAGEPPSKAILLTPNRDKKVYLYLSGEAMGLYAETSFNPVPPISGVIIHELMFSIRGPDKTKPALGYLTFVPQKGEYKGGYFLSHRIDPKLGKILDEYYLN
ncbi:MAG: hypothetical protein JNL11_00815 [Bdellovibrionaceae bacterium]|nr:hypothetical protein [Pseudobdellovibrionaceae bacterium]